MSVTAERITKVKLQRVIEVLGGQSEAARLLGVHRSRITRWLAGETPDPRNRAKLEALEFIIGRLLQTFLPDTARKWLTGCHPLLHNHQPLYMIECNRIAAVLEAIEQDEAGSYT